MGKPKGWVKIASGFLNSIPAYSELTGTAPNSETELTGPQATGLAAAIYQLKEGRDAALCVPTLAFKPRRT